MRWAARLAVFMLRLLGKTWRLRTHGVPAAKTDSRFVEAFLHGDILCFTWVYRHSPSVTMVSEHRDGQIITEFLERFGHEICRGSSTRGGARAYLDMLNNHQDKGWVMTPDGPRGPRGSVQGGVIKLASDGKRAIRPHGFAVSSAKRLKSWDRFTIPYPLARVVHFVGEPMQVPPKVDRATRKELARELEQRLADANRQAELILAKMLHPEDANNAAPDSAQ